MEITHVSNSDSGGGAARAAFRLNEALQNDGVHSQMAVNHGFTGHWSVKTETSGLDKLAKLIRPKIGSLASHLHTSKEASPLSYALLPSRWPKRLNSSNADIIHLHWICGEMMSIFDLPQIHKPMLWTLHDMWPFSGAEHCPTSDRWVNGYHADNRLQLEDGIDMSRLTWRLKRKSWTRPFQLVTPSHWMEQCVRKSALMNEWPVTTIHNPIDTNRWRPIETCTAREIIGLPQCEPIITFSALGKSGAPFYKGSDLLIKSVDFIKVKYPNLNVIILGQTAPDPKYVQDKKTHYLGHLSDDYSLRLAYSASDAVIIPSRIDNLPNIGLEALACGTPIAAFDAAGLSDIVTHQKTGWLSPAFDCSHLADGVDWIISDPTRHKELRRNARSDAVSRFSYPNISKKYRDLYENILM